MLLPPFARTGPAAALDLLLLAVDEDIVLHEVVPAVVEVDESEDAAGDDVADHVHATRVVVQIDAPRVVGRDPPAVLLAVAQDVVEVVVANDRASRAQPVPAAGVDRTRVRGLQIHVPDVVVFDDQIVASEPDAPARAVVDEIVRCTVAAAGQRHADALLVEDADVVDVVVVRVVTGGCQRLAVAASHTDAVATDLVDVVAHDAVVFSAAH